MQHKQGEEKILMLARASKCHANAPTKCDGLKAPSFRPHLCLITCSHKFSMSFIYYLFNAAREKTEPNNSGRSKCQNRKHKARVPSVAQRPWNH